MDGTVVSTSEEGEIATFTTNANWAQANNNQSNSTFVFIAVGNDLENQKVLESNGVSFKVEYDFKFETESFSSQPSSSFNSEFNQHVSTLDPNMSSTARYSPVYTEEVVTSSSNSNIPVVDPLIASELEASTSSPPDSCFQDITDAETQLLRQVVGNRYLQMVTPANQSEEATDHEENTAVHINYNQRSPVVDEQEQIISKELQLVQFPINNYQQQLSMVDRNLKIDTEHVELLITDQNTGISYSGYVSQDFLNNRSLASIPEDDQQLNNVLNTLESHGLVMETQEGDINEVSHQNTSLTLSDGQMILQDPLLDSDLLLQAPEEIALDDNVLSTTNSLILKSDLSSSKQQVVNPTQATISQKSNITFDVNVKKEIEFDDLGLSTEFKAQQLRRSQRQNELRQSFEDDAILFNRVQSISDKPVPSRARATLPATYLVINKVSSSSSSIDSRAEFGVFARKAISKRTQFGPLEGVVLNTPVNLQQEVNQNPTKLKLLLESDTGSMHELDTSDENTSNWMRFVRPAKNYNEQNLVLSQQGYSLYFTTTRAILPRQELQVGYSTLYAAKRKLTTLQPSQEEENSWSCFECPLKFSSSEELQKHLNVHDEIKEETLKQRCKRLNRLKRRPIECPHCSKTFIKRHNLNVHLQHHSIPNTVKEKQMKQIKRVYVSTENIDKILEWICGICELSFPTPSLLNLHELVHKNESSEIITGHPRDLGSGCNEGEFLIHNGDVQCPQCGIEYENRKLLIEHVIVHGNKPSTPLNDTVSSEQPKKGFKCYMCYRTLVSRERLQRHMLVHGSEDLKPLKCDTCSKRFLNNSALSCHLKTHKLDKKIFECPICKLSFDQILLLKEHVRCHCIDGVYTCPLCNKIFKEYSIIRKHIRAFHCERKHECQFCGKPFNTLDKLRMHLLKHSDHREFLCSECGKQFKRKDKLKEHVKRMHAVDRELHNKYNNLNNKGKNNNSNVVNKKFMPKVQPTDYHRFIYKCHTCLLGFKRRGMLVNHLAKRHPDISPESVPELNLPILKTTRDYYCQYCDKVYKSSSKRKAHILKNHPGSELPMSNRRKGAFPDIPGVPNPTFSQTVGSVTTNPHSCQWCHKQYASKAKLLQHQRKKHQEMLPAAKKQPKPVQKMHDISGNQQKPMSPELNCLGIPEEGKFMNSPDIPDSAACASSTILTTDIQEMSEEQLNVLSVNGFLHYNDVKVINNVKHSFKLSEESVLQDSSSVTNEFENCRTTNNQYYKLMQLSPNQLTINHTVEDESVDDPPEPSRLYRLLTTNGPFPPYPPHPPR